VIGFAACELDELLEVLSTAELGAPVTRGLASEAGVVVVVGHGGSPEEPADLPFLELSNSANGTVSDYEILDVHDALGVEIAFTRQGAEVIRRRCRAGPWGGCVRP
jgi:hypothetical protein